MLADWSQLFAPGVGVLEKLIRTVIVYVFLIFGLRLAGKRELAQLNNFDLVVLLLLSNTVQNALIGDDNSLAGGLVGAGALLLINYFVVRFLYGHEKLDRLVEGEPALLIDHGKILADQLEKELITPIELEIAAHKQGFASLEEIERATLEPGGAIVFVAKEPRMGEVRYSEIKTQLDQIARDLAALRTSLGSNAD